MMDEKIFVLCEGQSEESFVKKILNPYLKEYRIYCIACILGKKGGVSRYAQIRGDIRLLGRDTSCYLTTMLDYYKLPQDVPGVRECIEREPEQIGRFIEKRMHEDLHGQLNCKAYIPNILIHEYETLLFSNPSCFDTCDGIGKKELERLKQIRERFKTPEHINNSEQTAPSKRILSIYPAYQKVTDGTAVALKVGIEQMTSECQHFARWIDRLTRIREESSFKY